ncbi:MAG: hypothetical protein A3C84_04875 [Candidatus Ryanbacteria bacterium RIFCSPHIGHO2_02_FULL_48_12]|nr:MAG: hypothetical protein A3C84_04875 [Candidatus Ryanbacteria bacterium RIFCSPHIGHO2_02_FULL_48_12]
MAKMAKKQSAKAVIIFSTAYLPLASGAELAIQEVTDRIGDLDFFLFTCRMDRRYPARERIGNVEVRRLGLGVPFVDKLLAPMLGMHAARQIMREHEVRMFWGVMVSYMTLVPPLLKRLRLDKGIPFLLTLQEGDSEEYLRHARAGLIGFSWRFALRHATRVHAISMYLMHLAKYFGYLGPVVVIPNGVATDVFMPHERTGPSYVVITTSRLVKKNGIDVLIHAIAEVEKRYPDVICRIVGDGVLRRDLEALVHSLGLSGKVLFRGALPFSLIHKELATADVFVRPSRSEGLGTSFLEAMAAGLPVVATKVGGIEDFLSDGITGLFANTEDPHDVAEKIMMLFADHALYASLAAAARTRFVESYSWDHVASQMEALMKEL